MGLIAWLQRIATPPAPPPALLLTTAELLHSFGLDAPIRCYPCGYDLRGLPPNSKCPECGGPTPMSKLTFLAYHTGFPIDAFLFFLEAIRLPAPAGEAPPPGTHQSARQFYAKLRDSAVAQTGSTGHAIALMDWWGITRAEEVGAIIYAMVSLNFLRTSDDDRIEQFDGLPDIEHFFDAPAE
jgi:uncharacterized repeat protein (TIGR04138 family)